MPGNKIDIHAAAGEGNLGEVKAFLKAGGIIDKRDPDRWTPLMFAVREGHLEVAKQLLRSGAALEAKDRDKWTAMHVAAANGHPQCCQLLLDRGANPRATDENKRTPLHWATRYGYAAVVELLLKRGADPNSKDAEEKTPGDVIGNDLTEDSSTIVHNLLREHAEKVKANRQRRGSCPAVPRTAMIAAINASNGSVGASAPEAASSSTSPKKHSALLPLPNVLVARTDLVESSSNRAEPTVDDFETVGQPVRHTSFSVAANIRDHPTADKTQGRSVKPALSNAEVAAPSASPQPAKSGTGPSIPASGDSRHASSSKGSRKASGDAVEEGALAGGGGMTLHDEEREGAGEHVEDWRGEVARLRLALERAEERARLSERSLSEAEERRLGEEARAKGLEQRVAELEKLLSEQAGNSGTPVVDAS